MTCTGRYAEAWQFAAFFCIKSLVSGYDMGGAIAPAPPNAFLTDDYQNFLIDGGRANTGQVLYNLTQNTFGFITGITETTITATGVTWYDGDNYRVVFVNAAERAQIEHWLNITSGNIQAALGAVGACDCSFSVWGATHLAKINIIEARSFFDCPCSPSMSDTEKQSLRDLASEMLRQIRAGEVDVCEGATGTGFPVIDWAEQAVNEFSAAKIIFNEETRDT
jgi:hypothetical protein